MPTNFDAIAWAPLCIAVTAVGLVLSWFAWRRRGAASGLRGTAYSLLPLGLYLTGVIPLLWRVGTQIVNWAAGLIFKPTVWAGVLVLGLAVLLWVVSGMLLRHKVSKSNKGGTDDKPSTAPRAASSGGAPAAVRDRSSAPAQPASGGAAGGAGGDDMADIEELLRKRGIE